MKMQGVHVHGVDGGRVRYIGEISLSKNGYCEYEGLRGRLRLNAPNYASRGSWGRDRGTIYFATKFPCPEVLDAFAAALNPTAVCGSTRYEPAG